MFVQAEIDSLSPQAFRKLQKGLPVRIKMGQGMMITLPIEQAKKLARVGMKGKGMMFRNTEDIVKAASRFGMGQVSEDLKRSAGDNAINLMTASTDRGIKGISGNGMPKTGEEAYAQAQAQKGRGAVSEDLKRSAADNAINLMTASTDRGIKGIKGNGAVSKMLKQAAAENLINIMTASTDRGIKGIKGNGRTKTEKKYLAMIGRGQVSEDLKRSAGDNAINLMTASTDRGIKGISGNGMTKKDLTKLIINKNKVIAGLENEVFGGGKVSKQLKQAAAQNLINIMTASTDRGIKGIKGNGVSGAKKFEKYSSAIGDVLGLNSKAARDAKKQIMGAVGDAGSTYILSQVPGSQYASPPPSYERPQAPQYQPPPMMPQAPQAPTAPRPRAPRAPKVPRMPKAPAVQEPEIFNPNKMSSANIDSYVLPSGKLYASGLKRDRPKRVMSEKQMAALAKGREALRMRLNQMSGMALYNAGYTSSNS
jgi:hypothetical protein